MKRSCTGAVSNQRSILEDKRKRREEMNFCPVAGVAGLSTVCAFPGERNVNLFYGLNLAQKPTYRRALAGRRPRAMGLQGPTLEGKSTLRLIHWIGCQRKEMESEGAS